MNCAQPLGIRPDERQGVAELGAHPPPPAATMGETIRAAQGRWTRVAAPWRLRGHRCSALLPCPLRAPQPSACRGVTGRARLPQRSAGEGALTSPDQASGLPRGTTGNAISRRGFSSERWMVPVMPLGILLCQEDGGVGHGLGSFDHLRRYCPYPSPPACQPSVSTTRDGLRQLTAMLSGSRSAASPCTTVQHAFDTHRRWTRPW